MASITKQRVGKYTYLYESVSFRDEQGRPRNKKTKIGKLDLITGEPIYTEEYLSRVSNDISSIITVAPDKHPYVEAKGAIAHLLDNVKSFGLYYFLSEIAKKIGLWDVLQKAIPNCWQEVFTLACHLVASDKPSMYCEDWLSEQDWMPVSSMSSQRISELFAHLSEADRFAFYRAWCSFIQDREYIALDMTSISSYSGNIADCEWGYNRDKEKLPQINLCMLYGASSRLPVYQTHYSGSLKDVSSLDSTLLEFKALIGDRPILTVMDKGFYSAKNINMLLKKEVPFLVSMPFTNNFAKQQVEHVRNHIDQVSNLIHTSSSPIRGVHRITTWGKEGKQLHVHVFYNPQIALQEQNELFELVSKLRNIATKDPNNSSHQKEFKRFLCINTETLDDATQNTVVEIREDAVAKHLAYAGWFVLISDYISDAQEAYDIYRMKDGVEKSFWKYKNSLGLDRLRIHSDRRMLNKTFIAFIALILSSHIDNVLKDKSLYKQYTFNKLMITLSTLKSVSISGQYFLRPLTRVCFQTIQDM